jgi:phenylalanyl-tRNA synthetase beta chain
MNILVPDSWLREYLKTDATTKQIKECLSLCGPSVERIHTVKGETVYDIEITSNRPDAMSVMGVAREACVILPRFGIHATLVGDPYTTKYTLPAGKNTSLPLSVTTDPKLNPRWTSVLFDSVKIQPSPAWLVKRLELVGVRSLNNVIDITNYLMHAFGQPAHVFDYDRITHGVMKLRAAKKGETVVTLDGKTRTLPGGDIVIEDGSENLIDLCGIMGGDSSSITDKTTRVILFLQTYDASHIRKTSMALAHHSEASGLFEKGLDTELVMPVFLEGIQLMQKLSGGKIASSITDLYPTPYKAPTVTVLRTKIDSYIGTPLKTKEITDILTKLGCTVDVTDTKVVVQPPSYRRDISIDVDIIEELARIYGYHTIKGILPEGEPPMTFEEPILRREQLIKTKLSDWGYTETYTYSMVSKATLDLFHIDDTNTYAITNPISADWVYMRPTLLPSMLLCVKQNMPYEQDVKLFELSMTYAYRKNNLPLEESTLIIAVSGSRYGKVKGIAEAIFSVFGIEFPQMTEPATQYYQHGRSLRLGNFGQLGEIDPVLLGTIGITKPVTILELSVDQLVKHAAPTKKFIPIPKNPASYEDLAFVVSDNTYVAPMIAFIRTIDPLIRSVSLFDSYNTIRTFHITYQSDTKTLTTDDIAAIREKIIKRMKQKYNATLKTI